MECQSRSWDVHTVLGSLTSSSVIGYTEDYPENAKLDAGRPRSETEMHLWGRVLPGQHGGVEDVPATAMQQDQ